jgi:hypothetical protein
MHPYQLHYQRGIHDLKGRLPEQGTEWWTEDQWAEHYRKLPACERFNRMYVNWLIRKGRFGVKYTINLYLENHPVWDDPNPSKKENLVSFKSVILNF